MPAGENNAPGAPPGFSERGRMRRRLRFLRKARELAYRDLGGLVFDLHRFGRRNDALVLAKLETIGRIDTELRALEATLAERQGVTVLREAGVAACPRCAASSLIPWIAVRGVRISCETRAITSFLVCCNSCCRVISESEATMPNTEPGPSSPSTPQPYAG